MKKQKFSEKRKFEIVVGDPEHFELERPHPKRADIERPEHEQSELEHRGQPALEPDDTVLPHDGTTLFTNLASAPAAPSAETATTSAAGADSSYYLPTQRESQYSQNLKAKTKSLTTTQPTIGIVPEGQGSQVDPIVDRQKEQPADTQDIVDSPPKDSGSYVSGTAGEHAEETQAHHEEQLRPDTLAVTPGEGTTHGLSEEVTHGGSTGAPTTTAPPPGTEGQSQPTEGGQSASGSIGPSTGDNSNPDTEDEDREAMPPKREPKKEPEPYPKGTRGSPHNESFYFFDHIIPSRTTQVANFQLANHVCYRDRNRNISDPVVAEIVENVVDEELDDGQRWNIFLDDRFDPFNGKPEAYQKLHTTLEGKVYGDEEGFGMNAEYARIHLAVFVSGRPDSPNVSMVNSIRNNMIQSYRDLQNLGDKATQQIEWLGPHPNDERTLDEMSITLRDYSGCMSRCVDARQALFGITRTATSGKPVRDHHEFLVKFHDYQMDMMKLHLERTGRNPGPRTTGRTTGSEATGGDFLGKIKSPHFKLPSWDGKATSWARYWYVFNDLYHANQKAPVSIKLAALEASLPHLEKQRLATYKYSLEGYEAYIKDLLKRNESIEQETRLLHKAKIQTMTPCVTGHAEQFSVGEIFKRLSSFKDHILTAKRGFENVGDQSVGIVGSEWFPYVERKITGVEKEKWIAYVYNQKSIAQWDRQEQFDHFLEWLEGRVEDLRKESERASVQIDIERSITQHANGRGKTGNKITHTTHAVNSFKRNTPKKKEYKADYPNSCPWILTHGKKCGQSHAPSSCNNKQWLYDKVWPTVYSERLCPICLCTGHTSKECNMRNRGPCNRTVAGGERCPHYHHAKLCQTPFMSFRTYRDQANPGTPPAQSNTTNYSTKTAVSASSKGRRSSDRGKKGGNKKSNSDSTK